MASEGRRWRSAMIRAARLAGFALLFALSACEARQLVLVPGLDGALPPGTDPIPPAPDGLEGLRIDPVFATLLDSQAPPATTRFRALGVFSDHEEDLSALVLWALDQPELGSLAQGNFVASGQPGTSGIVARVGTFVAEASVTVQVDRVIVAPGLPPSIVARFPEDPSGDAPDGPVFSYPPSEVVVPRNMPPLEFQWALVPGAEAYELRFESSDGILRFYTADAVLAPELAAWTGWIAAHRGRTFSFSVRAANSSGIHRSAQSRVMVSESAIEGPAYFWSTKAAAILKASLGDRTATRFFPNAPQPPPRDGGVDDAGNPIEIQDDTNCAACHTLSRDGRKMALGFEGEKLLLLDVSGASPVALGPPREQRFGFGAFSPDTTRLVFADRGRLRVMDLGNFDVTSASSGEEENAMSQPDWSPDGSSIIVAYSREDEANNQDTQHETSLARIPVASDGRLGAPEVIVRATDEDDVMHSPSHSPDGRWVAYVRSHEDSKDNPRSEIWLVRSDGRSAPLRLDRLNEIVGPVLDASQIGNTMPTWVRGDGGHAWLVFSSRREYGGRLDRDRRDQLWVSSIDLDRATQGVDPSAPAFWLPFQALDDDAHRAFFASPTP